MPSWPLRGPQRTGNPDDAERRRRHSHAERGNELTFSGSAADVPMPTDCPPRPDAPREADAVRERVRRGGAGGDARGAVALGHAGDLAGHAPAALPGEGAERDLPL